MIAQSEPHSAHPRDISAADLRLALAEHENADLLLHLVKLSRQAFGFYTSQFSYTINYPWIAARLARLPAGARALDIGAGLSPVPLFLAEKGVRVDCVDNSSNIRQLPSAADWNEWGFFDYSVLHASLRAHHCDIMHFVPSARFDAIYSICVLAHMPRTVREKTLQDCHEWLVPKGRLFLAIDVIPSTDFLWNRTGNREVEAPVQHGTIEHVTGQLERLGFQIQECKVQRTVPKSRTDLLFIAARNERESDSPSGKRISA